MMLLTQLHRKLSNKIFPKPKANLFVILLLISSIGFSQENSDSLTISKKKRYTYTQFELSVPISVNQYAGEVDEYGDSEPWFIPGGVIARFGMGLKINKFVSVGGNIGIDWKAKEDLVVVPLFGTIRISSKVSDSMKIYVEPGLGRAMKIGRHDLEGNFKKISIGFETEFRNTTCGLLIEFCQYGLRRTTGKRIGSISLGLFLSL